MVNLSSFGAHLPEGAGPVSGAYRVEQALNTLDESVSVVHLRPGYFYYNLLNNINMIKHMGITGANYGGEGFTLPLVAPTDIAAVAAEELGYTHENAVKKIRYIVSDEATTDQIAAALGNAIGKPGLSWVAFSDEQMLQGALQAGLPQEVANNFVEMGGALRSGKMSEDYLLHKPETFGNVKLADFAQTFGSSIQLP